jgi:hypothetical protein
MAPLKNGGKHRFGNVTARDLTWVYNYIHCHPYVTWVCHNWRSTVVYCGVSAHQVLWTGPQKLNLTIALYFSGTKQRPKWSSISRMKEATKRNWWSSRLHFKLTDQPEERTRLWWITVKAFNFGPFRARSVASLGELRIKIKQNKVCKSKVFLQLTFSSFFCRTHSDYSKHFWKK